MNFAQAVKNINRSIAKKQPPTVNPMWIKYRCRVSYNFIVDTTRTTLGEPDWDFVVSHLERCNQKLWLKRRKRKRKTVARYHDIAELDAILREHEDKLYTFFGYVNKKEDRIACDWICIRLARLAQRGNIDANDRLTEWLTFLVYEWIENDRALFVWRGREALITEHIILCIRRFRYAGSFIGYLYRTLEYAGLGLVPLEKFSLDAYSLSTEKRIVETFLQKPVSA